MSSEIRTLKDGSVDVYPKTLGDAVVLDDGRTVQDFADATVSPWKATVTPSSTNVYLVIQLASISGNPKGCVLSLDSVGDNSIHGIICISDVMDITSAVFVGAGVIDTSEDVEIGTDANDNAIVQIKCNGDVFPVAITCLGGTAPTSAAVYANDMMGSSSDSKAWTDLEAGGGGTTEVFWATYGTTTYSEISAAITAGKVVECMYDTRTYIIARSTDSNHIFVNINGVYERTLTLTSANVWSNAIEATLQTAGNKADTITASNYSSSYAYPSLAALNASLYKWGVVSQTQTWSGTGSNPRTYTIDPASIVRGIIPQANIDLFVAAGATFNATSGYFELNGLTDISYEEMRVIYEHPIRNASDLINEGIFAVNQRTTLPLSRWGPNQSISSSQAFANGSMLEVVDMSTFHNYPLRFTAYTQFFIGCSWLREVIGSIRIIGGMATTEIFKNCYSLETVYQSHIERNTTFAQSSALSLASVVYMVENAANTSAITITLHATAYARCQADTTEYTYGGQTYTGILALATAHNITIASA